MKHLASIISIFYCLQCFSQTSESYYDYYWKLCEPGNARYYSTIKKTDSGWLRSDYYVAGNTQQMQALYSDSKCTVKDGYYKFFMLIASLLQ